MRTIYKYQLRLADEQTMKVPGFFQPLDVQLQDGVITVWAEVDTRREQEEMTFFIRGTGREMPLCDRLYIGTVQMGALVWHVYCGTQFNVHGGSDAAS